MLVPSQLVAVAESLDALVFVCGRLSMSVLSFELATSKVNRRSDDGALFPWQLVWLSASYHSWQLWVTLRRVDPYLSWCFG